MRAYGGSASSFAIGFSGEDLRKASKDYGWLAPVIYDEGRQRVLVRTLLQDVLGENLNPHPEVHLEIGPEGGNLIAYLYRYAPILKHKSFAEEREWRIVTHPLFYITEGFAYRTGASMLVPYFRIPLRKEEPQGTEEPQSLGIQEIVIGPTPHPEPSERSVNGLLMKNRVPVYGSFPPGGVKIRLSCIPYRTW